MAAPIPRVPPVTNATRDMSYSSQRYVLPTFFSRRRNEFEAAYSLRATDQHTFNIGRCRRTRHEHGIFRRHEPRVPIGMMKIGNDIGRVQQSDEMLREIAQRVHAEFGLAQPD